MYRLIYYFILKLIEKRNPDPKFGAASFVALIQVIHVFFILSVVKKIFDLSYPVFSEKYFVNKLFFMPVLIVWLIAVHIYFSKKSDEIEKAFVDKNVITLKNGIMIISIMIIPLIIGILLLKK